MAINTVLIQLRRRHEVWIPFFLRTVETRQIKRYDLSLFIVERVQQPHRQALSWRKQLP
jgi:hypothetical protein